MPIPRSFPRAASFSAILNLFSRFDESWQRQRVWGPMQVLLTLFALVEPGRASSYQWACKAAFAWADLRFGWKAVPDAAGFKRARDRLTDEACLTVLSQAQTMAQRRLCRLKRLVCGLLPIAVDGSILHMPRSRELVRRFGVPVDRLGCELCHYPQALLVTAWDLVRRIPIAWALEPHKCCERTAFLSLLAQVPLNALLILDRGYPSDVVFGRILAAKRHFIARMVATKGAAWREVADFLASGKRDAIVPVEVGSGDSRRIVSLRMVLRTFPRGRPHRHQRRETMVIITSVLNQTLSARDLCRLYGERWGIETIYREMKAVAKIEQWHGRSLSLVRQELILLLVWFCFAAIFAAVAHQSNHTSAGRSWRANTRRVFEAIAATVDALMATASRKPPVAAEIIRRAESALAFMCRYLLPIRRGRTYPRVPLHPYARGSRGY